MMTTGTKYRLCKQKNGFVSALELGHAKDTGAIEVKLID
jgi:hypothetical protein